ncbi:MAG: CopG family transcriptional regulator [Gammaproteobacteria bacterium]|nr:CopG family transcriptional regulator [Gammaproteobacteria bacterium]NNJ85376.1 CopG family transcriptional regulator [Gammaproteobacteria bacterium]
MIEPSRRSIIDFEPGIHEALRMKSVLNHRSISDIVNEAIRQTLLEDQEDLAAFEERAAEPTMTYEELLNDLKAHGRF